MGTRSARHWIKTGVFCPPPRLPSESRTGSTRLPATGPRSFWRPDPARPAGGPDGPIGECGEGEEGNVQGAQGIGGGDKERKGMCRGYRV